MKPMGMARSGPARHASLCIKKRKKNNCRENTACPQMTEANVPATSKYEPAPLYVLIREQFSLKLQKKKKHLKQEADIKHQIVMTSLLAFQCKIILH